jgi:polyisoprenoid-binding protein YceI
MKKLVGLFCLAVFLWAAPPAKAGGTVPDRYVFDPAHTQVFFSVDHLGLSHPMGRFDDIKGGFTFNPAAPEKSSIDVTIKAASVDMGRDGWSRAVAGSHLLDAGKFPDIRFKSTSVHVTDKKTGTVTGDLTLHGVTRPVTMDVTYNGSRTHPLNRNYLAGFSARLHLRRSDFGMTFGLPDIGDDVTITIEVEGIRQDFTNLPR